jgi:hypothetical protein
VPRLRLGAGKVMQRGPRRFWIGGLTRASWLVAHGIAFEKAEQDGENHVAFLLSDPDGRADALEARFRSDPLLRRLSAARTALVEAVHRAHREGQCLPEDIADFLAAINTEPDA